ncbi:MAG TPA: histidine kinase N-terminal domain-containing protein [Thermoguttaceae bacterium]|nr:histidine kinase N-terminal domain-containing protein [Thermoguttaceae bacterium]
MDDAYRRYFDAMPCYLSVQDRHFRIMDANRRFRDDFGEIEDRFCYQVYKQRSEKCEVCPVEEAFRDGQSHRNEERVQCLDGTEVRVLVEATPIRDESGEVVAVIEMSTDITQIKSLERQLRRSRRRYRLLFDEVPCYITIQDSQLHVVEANRAFQDDFGNGLGRKCYEAYKHRTEPCVPCPVQETFEDGQTRTREEVLTSLGGRQIHVLVTTAPIRDGTGRITGVMEMSADITQVRELEDRLTSLGLLIGSVSHGLRGMLNGLAGGMYLVDTGFKKDDHERIHKGWATVGRNVTRIRNMVSDILYYAKDRVPNWEPLSAVEVAEEVCSLTEPRAKDHNAQLTATLDPQAGLFEADAQAVRSLLVNLLENSLDACRSDGGKDLHQVDLRLRGSADHVEFEVEDNGIGMDRETREKAFSLFFSSKGTEGTGLGLFISDRIARSHGGTIELESEPGVGTRFIVRLPRKRPGMQEPEDPQSFQTEAFHG